LLETIYIGIGTSAGGLEVLEKLVAKLPKDRNFVYIIAQHLDPNKNSLLTQILTRNSSLPVLEAEIECKFLTNHIYIIPPGYNIVFRNYHLSLEKIPLPYHAPTPSIDKFFEALSLYKKNSVIGIVLTGSGKDATIGIQKIKEAGGTTIAQLPDEALYANMPQNAINSGNIDHIFSIEEITQYISSLSKKQSQQPDYTQEFNKIKTLLNNQKNFNMEKYKAETILRRIDKRMMIVHVKNIKEYLQYINHNTKELHLLHKSILIGVTEFFRDKKAFNALEEELLKNLQDKPNNYNLRVWSIACSSGEEAYSLAILISEISEKLNKNFIVNIFATDIDEDALQKAREAIYTKESLKDINKIIIDKYFTEVDSKYEVINSIRKQIIFTTHNILSEPPFIKQDIISCRNFLIYIDPKFQKEIFTLFHYSLKENGILFLGSSESTLSSVKYFNPLNSEYKIYKKEKLKNPPKISTHYFSKHLSTKRDKPIMQTQKNEDIDIEEELSKRVFNFFAPNCILVDKDYSIIYKKGKLPFLHINDGFVSLNIIDNIDKSLQYELNILLAHAFKSDAIQTTKFIQLKLNNLENTFIKIIAYPFSIQQDKSMFLLYFQELNIEDLHFNLENSPLKNESFMLNNLNYQLTKAQDEVYKLTRSITKNKENQQLLHEELQSSNEELQSSNEELVTKFK